MATNMNYYSESSLRLSVNQYMSKVYSWMTGGILLTGFISMLMAQNDQVIIQMASNPWLFVMLMIIEMVLVVWLSAAVDKISNGLATFIFLAYAGLNGVTLSLITLVFTQSSLQSAFFVTSTAFAGLSFVGYTTKKDLGPVATFCTMGLFGIIGYSLFSLFFPQLIGGTSGQVFGIVGLIVFSGLTAYDTQAIKNMAPHGNFVHKGAIMGALKLYLDFINLFLFVLHFTGGRRRN